MRENNSAKNKKQKMWKKITRWLVSLSHPFPTFFGCFRWKFRTLWSWTKNGNEKVVFHWPNVIYDVNNKTCRIHMPCALNNYNTRHDLSVLPFSFLFFSFYKNRFYVNTTSDLHQHVLGGNISFLGVVMGLEFWNYTGRWRFLYGCLVN